MTSSSLPKIVGVYGGGRMGAGIAHAFLISGSRVVLIEVDDRAASAATRAVSANVARSAERGRLAAGSDDRAVASTVARFTAGTDPDLLAEVGLVVEAVPEDPALKKTVLARAARIVGAETTIASNTSSLSIDELGTAVEGPERFLGLHFFNPVPASSLVEIVTGSATSALVTEAAQSWVRELGKTPVTVRNSPGFASSRLGVMLGLEAIRMLEEGVASAEDIDAAMVLGYRHPMGPLRLTDLVGLDVRLAVAEYLSGALGERFTPPDLLRAKVAAGELGQKAGRGFYDWSAG